MTLLIPIFWKSPAAQDKRFVSSKYSMRKTQWVNVSSHIVIIAMLTCHGTNIRPNIALRERIQQKPHAGPQI
jgi:hypothetical protein